MATFLNDLRLKEIATGDESGTWGTSTNANLALIADAFSLGTKQMAANANETFTMPDATADGTRSLYLKITSAVSLTVTRTVTLAPNTVSKVWIIENATSGAQSIIIAQGSGATVTVPTGQKIMIVTDGAGAGAAVTLASPTVNLASDVTGTLPVANGGTGITSFGAGVATFLGTPTSANLAAAVTNETGSGALVFATSPALVTPALGTPSSGVLTNATGLPIVAGTTGTLSVARGGTGITSFGAGVAAFLGTPTSANLAAAVTNETGSGALVFATSPALITPALGTPSSVVLTNGTGLPITTGVSGLSAGVATFLATPSSANLAAAVTNETGTGALVFATSPALVTPALGTPSSASLINAINLPIVAGTTGTLSVARGGTNQTSYVDGELLIGNTTGNTLTKGTLTAGSGVSITNGTGSITIAATGSGGTVTSVGGTGTVNGITLTGTVTSSGNLTLGGTLSGVSLTTQVTGTLPVANGGTGITSFGAGVAAFLGTPTSANLAAAVTNETGSGALVFATSPALITPALGTPSSVVLTNGTGLPITTGVSGLSAGVATFLATPSSANLAAAVTNETGTGALVFATSPAFVTPALGTPSSASLINAINLPIVAGTTGTLSVARGGTGATTLTANNVLLGNGTSSPLFVAPGTSGNVLTSNGTTWTSAAAAAALTGTTQSATPFLTALGSDAGAVTTGQQNTFVGFEAGKATTTGSFNTAVGASSLRAYTGGDFGSNVAVGFDAMCSTTNGCLNAAVGSCALQNNTTGGLHAAVGNAALRNNTTGVANTAIGLNALTSNTTGIGNIATGFQTLSSNTTGNFNTGAGLCAIISNTSGISNTGIGNQAVFSNTTGCFNTGLGLDALRNNTTARDNTALGVCALRNNTTGCNNIGVGANAGRTGGGPEGIVNITTESDRIVMGNDAHTCAQIKIAWTVTSDCRDKLCFAPIAHGLDFVRALKPTEYQFKTGGRDSTETDGKRRYGFLAQDVLPLEGENPVIISAGNPDKLQYTESHLIPVLVKAIQELTLKNEALEARLGALENA